MVLLRITIPIFILFLFIGTTNEKSTDSIKETCSSSEELKLYNLINDYRKKKGLPKIPLSKSLSYVAQTHSKDLMENNLVHDNCNMHSWSSKGKWTSCCYTPDHKQAECMWSKPKELTNYTGNGYEIACFSTPEIIPEQALELWKKSSGHNPLIINSGIWKNYKWKAIGIGIYKNYATVWFGVEADKEGEPGKCN